MDFIFSSNEHLVTELKKLMLESKITQKEIASNLGIKPQGLTKILAKKKLGFEDVQKVLDTMGYSLVVGFQKKD